MSTRIPFVIGLTLVFMQVSLSAEPVISKDWIKVQTAKHEIWPILVRDGWLVWVESELDKATAGNRVQTHYFTGCRRELKKDKAERLFELSESGRNPRVALGDRGMVVWSLSDGSAAKLSIPGEKTIDVEHKMGDDTYDAAIFPHEKGLVCEHRWGAGDGVSWLPLKEGKLDTDKRQTILTVNPEQLPPEKRIMLGQLASHSTACLLTNGKFVTYCRTDRKEKFLVETVLWDLEKKEIRWVAHGWPVGIDDKYVYVTPRDRPESYGTVSIIRHSIDGKETPKTTEKWKPESRMTTIISFTPGYVTASYQEGQKVNVKRFDLIQGERRSVTLPMEFRKVYHRIAADASQESFLANVDRTIYRVDFPQSSAEKIKVEWKPVKGDFFE